MSGHSKWATIHRQKEVKDAARGKLFSKLARAITIAAKTGGGPNPDSNFKLKDAIDKARVANMPKDNIDRAISKATESGDLDEVVYEGFGPNGISLIIEVATDNRNRSSQTIKNLLEKSGGSLGGPGSTSFNFRPSGLILVSKTQDPDSQMLQIIDFDVDDVQDTGDQLEVYTRPEALYEVRKKIEDAEFEIISSELIQKTINPQVIEDGSASQKVLDFLDNLEEQDDVQRVFTNADLNL